jgi:hypothetical protein
VSNIARRSCAVRAARCARCAGVAPQHAISLYISFVCGWLCTGIWAGFGVPLIRKTMKVVFVVSLVHLPHHTHINHPPHHTTRDIPPAPHHPQHTTRNTPPAPPPAPLTRPHPSHHTPAPHSYVLVPLTSSPSYSSLPNLQKKYL